MTAFLLFLLCILAICDSLCTTNQVTGTFCTNIDFRNDFRLNYVMNEDLFVKNGRGSISKNNFEFLGHLTSFHLSESDIEEIRPNALCSVRNLRFLTLKDNRNLPKLDKHVFRNCSQLEFLRIVIGRIRDEAFADMSHLETVILDKVTFVDGGLVKRTFKGLGNLKKLAILNSIIGKIEEGAFETLRNLQELFLEFNQIGYLSPTRLFHGLNNLEMLSLKAFPLSKIDWTKFHQFKLLTSLDLSTNDYQLLDFQSFVENIPRCCEKLKDVTMDTKDLNRDHGSILSTEMRKNNVTLTFS